MAKAASPTPKKPRKASVKPAAEEPAPVEEKPAPVPVTETRTERGGTTTLRWAGIGTAGAGAVLVGVGIAFGVKAKNISDDISSHPAGEPWANDIRQQQADGESAEKKQIIFLAAGGVALAAGVTMYVLGASKPRVVPMATGESVGLATFGTF